MQGTVNETKAGVHSLDTLAVSFSVNIQFTLIDKPLGILHFFTETTINSVLVSCNVMCYNDTLTVIVYFSLSPQFAEISNGVLCHRADSCLLDLITGV